ncbi:MAG: XdhC family protein [Ahrensia sp.]|nr:XdhC family protein [Ahrensia sp.]
MQATLISEINEARAKRRPVAVVTGLGDHAQRLVTADNAGGDPLGEAISNRFRSGKSGIVTDENGEHFIQVYVPPPRLVIIGAVHISQALAPMARSCNFDVTVIDPRTAFATPERFAETKLIADWPEDVLKDAPLDAYTALAALTHDPKIDDIPLKAALEAGCFYVGALGSRKTHAKRAARLMEVGITQSQMDGIDAPIGMDIGAANPAEIAVAVLARVIEALRKAPLEQVAAA